MPKQTKYLHTMIYHGSKESKRKFLENVFTISDSVSAFAKAVEEAPEQLFSENAAQACKDIKEKHGLRKSALLDFYS